MEFHSKNVHLKLLTIYNLFHLSSKFFIIALKCFQFITNSLFFYKIEFKLKKIWFYLKCMTIFIFATIHQNLYHLIKFLKKKFILSNISGNLSLFSHFKKLFMISSTNFFYFYKCITYSLK